jgi:hypothetical protein
MALTPPIGDGQGDDVLTDVLPRAPVAGEADMSVIVTGVKLDIGTIFGLVCAVSISQAVIFGIGFFILKSLGVF